MRKKATFREFVRGFEGDNSPLGDLADDVKSDHKLPRPFTPSSLIGHIQVRGGASEAIDAAREVAKLYLKEKSSSDPILALALDLLIELRHVEWKGWSEDGAACPRCGGQNEEVAGPDATGHLPDCTLAAALERARGEVG